MLLNTFDRKCDSYVQLKFNIITFLFDSIHNVAFTWLLNETREIILPTNLSFLLSYLKDDTRFFKKINFNIGTSNFACWSKMNTNEFTLFFIVVKNSFKFFKKNKKKRKEFHQIRIYKTR